MQAKEKPAAVSSGEQWVIQCFTQDIERIEITSSQKHYEQALSAGARTMLTPDMLPHKPQVFVVGFPRRGSVSMSNEGEIAELEKENADLKRQLEDRRNQLHVPIECLRFADAEEQWRFANESKETVVKSMAYTQELLDQHLVTVLVAITLK